MILEGGRAVVVEAVVADGDEDSEDGSSMILEGGRVVDIEAAATDGAEDSEGGR
jgi:hypothetical protein